MGDERLELAQIVCTLTIIRTNSLVNKLLGSFCLGLISDINCMLLQDVTGKGKKSVTVKRKILGILGALIVSEIVSAIHNVAPQVHSPDIHLHSGILLELDSGSNVSDHGQHTRAMRGSTTELVLVQVSYNLGFQRH